MALTSRRSFLRALGALALAPVALTHLPKSRVEPEPLPPVEPPVAAEDWRGRRAPECIACRVPYVRVTDRGSVRGWAHACGHEHRLRLQAARDDAAAAAYRLWLARMQYDQARSQPNTGIRDMRGIPQTSARP